MPQTQKLSDAELSRRLRKDMGKCPSCGEDDVCSGALGGDLIMDLSARCESCGATWVEHYQFKGASDFKV